MFINAKVIGANQKRGGANQPPRGDKSFIMSRTQLVAFALNPAKWIDGGEVEEESKAMRFGSVLDCLATTPDELLKKFAVTPELYPATPKKKGDEPEMKKWHSSTYCDKWKADKEAEGFTVVSPSLFEDAKKAHAALHANSAAAELIECSEKQVLISADWKDSKTRLMIPFSGLIDLVPPPNHPVWGKSLGDIKTTANANPALWARKIDDSGYDVQGALYFDIYRAARPNEDRTDFVHLVQESVFPFHVVNPIPALTSEFLSWGQEKYQSALARYAQCLATSVWPSYAVAGLRFGPTQLIGPDELWNYRKAGGVEMAKRIEYQPKLESEDVPS
jgi:hypothetical protein